MVASPLAFFVGLGGFALASLVAAGEAPKSGSDPCAAIAGKLFPKPSEARRCLKSFPYNATLANNVLEVVTKGKEFFTFEVEQKKTPAPFTEASSNLAVEFARIRDNAKHNKYKTDYGFNRDVYNVINRLDDGHTLWLPACYWAIFQNVAPAPLVALEKDGSQDIYIAPNAAELADSLGRAYTDYYTKELGFNYTKYAGAKVLKINGIDAWTYVNQIATNNSGIFIDHNIRVNRVFSSYSLSVGEYRQRFGDFANPLFPDKDSVTIALIRAGRDPKKVETVKFEYRAAYVGAPFTDGRSFWKANCAANAFTNGVDYRSFSASAKRNLLEKKRRPIAKISAAPVKSVKLPVGQQPTLPNIINNPGGEIKAYILPDKKTGVLVVGSFGGDYVGFQNDTLAALTKFKDARIEYLIIDVTGNGGGFVCLGQVHDRL